MRLAGTKSRVRKNVWVAAVLACAIAAHAADSHPRILRTITDPHTGRQWLLVANEQNPAGPGRLVSASGDLAAHRDGSRPALAIHAGDRIVVEEHSAVVNAYLEATALEPAAAGSQFNARLKIGGKVVKAVALGPGRAEAGR